MTRLQGGRNRGAEEEDDDFGALVCQWFVSDRQRDPGYSVTVERRSLLGPPGAEQGGGAGGREVEGGRGGGERRARRSRRGRVLKSFISRPVGVSDGKIEVPQTPFCRFPVPQTPFSSIFVSGWVGGGQGGNIKTGVWV